MPQVLPNKIFNILDGTELIRIKNDSLTVDGSCNIFTSSGSQNILLSPNQVKNVHLDGSDELRLDNVGKTVLTVTYL